MRSLIMAAAMARTLMSTTNLNHSYNISKLLQNQIPPFAAVHFPSFFQSNNLRLVSSRRIRCSFDYGSHVNGSSDTSKSYDGFAAGQQYPKPTEIQWKKELRNSVQLIGFIATPVEIKHFSSGKVFAWSRLGVSNSQTEINWINLKFWDDLAHVASQHLEKGHKIYVSGRLVSDTVESNNGKQQTSYKVVVQEMNYIERNAVAAGLNNGDANSGRNQPQYGAATTNSGSTNSGSTEELWRIRCSFDYGSHVNGSSDTSKSYDGFAAGQQYPKPTEIQWKKELCNSVQLIGFIAAPAKIKHLTSGKVLAWTRLGVRNSQTEINWIILIFWNDLAHVASQHLEKGHQIYVSGRLVIDTVESNDGKQKESCKVVVQEMNYIERNAAAAGLNNGDANSGRNQPQYGAATTNSGSTNSGSTEELWQALFANPLEWWDNRKNKRNPKYPDFKHKDTGEALWIEGRYNPPWVKSQLAILDTRMQSFHDQSGNNMSFSSMVSDSFPIR